MLSGGVNLRGNPKPFQNHILLPMNNIGSVGGDDYDEDQGEVFLEEEDVIQEIHLDEEELPDADDDEMSLEMEIKNVDDTVYSFTKHKGELYAVACCPSDATLVATGGGDDKGFMWRIGSIDWDIDLQGHTDSVSALAFSVDGKLLASGSFDGTIQVWDTTSSSLKCTLDGPVGGIEWLRWHPKGHLLLAGSEDSTAWLWNADRSTYLSMFSGHGSSVTCGDFTPDGKIICTGSDDATLRIWNPKTGETIHVVKGHPYHNDGLVCLAITSDSGVAITGAKDGSLYLVNISTGKVVSSLVGHSGSVECIELSESYSWAATAGMDGKLIIWDLQHSSPRCTCDHEEGVTCLLWLGNSKFVATGCIDGKVRIWDSLSGNCVRTFHGHDDAIEALALSSDKQHIVSVSLDNIACVFDISEFH